MIRVLLLLALLGASINVDAQVSKAEWEKKASQGDPRAQYELGRNYFYCVINAVLKYEYSDSDKSTIKEFEILEDAQRAYKHFEAEKGTWHPNALKRRQQEMVEMFNAMLSYYKESSNVIDIMAILNKAMQEEKASFLSAKKYFKLALDQRYLDAEEYLDMIAILEKQ